MTFFLSCKGEKTPQENTWNEFKSLRWQCTRPRKDLKFSINQHFGGCCSSDNTWQHTSRIPTSLPWLTLLCRLLVLWEVFIHCLDNFDIPTYPVNKFGPIYTFIGWTHHNIQWYCKFRVGKGSEVRELNSFRVYFFIFGVSLPVLLWWTVLQWSHYRNTNISLLLVSLDNTLEELFASPLHARNLSLLCTFIYLFYRSVH